jgi:hypothetical protein
MSSFNEVYVRLLREQVDVEIQYLTQNGHDTDKIYQNCLFCHDTQKGHYRCNRLTELKQFQSQLAVWKKGIGEIEKFKFETKQLPPMYPKL